MPWNRIPLLVRAVVGGVVVSFAGALFWVWLWRANLDSTPRFPWALGAMAIFLVLYVWYLSGHGWPKGTAAARAECARGFPTRKVWIWGLLAALAGALFSEEVWFATLRFAHLPAGAFRLSHDSSKMPIWMLMSFAAMTAVVAALTEELGFRGYMQRPLEKRYGPAAAIAISTVTFFAIHLHHEWASLVMAVPYLAGGAFLGALAYASGSLLPGMVAHALIDVYDLLFEWEIVGSYDLSPLPPSGIDAQLATSLGGTVVFGIATVFALQKLARVTRAEVVR